MRPYRDVRRHRAHFFRRLFSLRKIYDEDEWRETNAHSQVIGGLVIGLDNLVVQGFRSYIHSLILAGQEAGTFRKVGGRYCNLSDYEFFVRTAIQSAATKPGGVPKKVKLKNEPPTLRYPDDVEKVLIYLFGGASQNFRNAKLLKPSAFGEVKHFRNFYAHRCDDTLTKVMAEVPRFQTSTLGHPDRFIEAVLPGQKAPTYVEWWTQTLEFFDVALLGS